MINKFAIRIVITPDTDADTLYAYNNGDQFIHESGAATAIHHAITFNTHAAAKHWLANEQSTTFDLVHPTEIVRLEVTHRIHHPVINQHSLNIAIIAMCQTGRRVAAIKLYREVQCTGLKEAKDYVDNLCPYTPEPAPEYVYQYLSKAVGDTWLTVDLKAYQRAQHEGFETRKLTVCN